jgi:hypothetical protein
METVHVVVSGPHQQLIADRIAIALRADRLLVEPPPLVNRVQRLGKAVAVGAELHALQSTFTVVVEVSEAGRAIW